MTHSTTPTPTGSVREGDRGREVRLVRRFNTPPEPVWAAMTESDRLERWIGRWDGDPSTGQVTFYMTAEGQDVPGGVFTIRECTPPHRFAADTEADGNHWSVEFSLDYDGSVTVLTFTQVLGADDSSQMGPGWEYYLDRLSTALDGGDVTSIEFGRYYPAMSDHYRNNS